MASRSRRQPAISPVAPKRSHDQRMDALRRANVIRSARAIVKVALRDPEVDGRQLLVDLVADPRSVGRLVALGPDAPDDVLDTMAVNALLKAARGIGRVKAAQMLKEAQTSPSKTLGGLSDRQRAELVILIRRRVKRHNPKGPQA